MDLDIPLDRAARALLPYQIGRGIIDLITSGAVTPGSRLPSTRELAKHLRVARMTVVDAYRWLTDQGYVESRQGSGTVVRKMRIAAPEQRRPARSTVKSGTTQRERGDVWAFDTTRTSSPSVKPKALGDEIDFRSGLPDLASFPRRHWTAALARSGRTLPDSSLGYGDPLGQERLRQAIASYLHRSRGLRVPSQNVVITAGAAQAMDILLRTWPEHREMVVEAPGPRALRTLPAIYPLALREVPIDHEGLRTDLLPRRGDRHRFAHVTPSHQLPLGCAMSLERRLELLAWAARTNALIIEDDYDSEFAYDGRPAAPLAQLDRAGRVIYSGTFSKTLVPALRIGFMVVPDHVLERIRQIKWWADSGGWVIQQDALAHWIENGLFERHVHRMRKVYHQRFVALTDALTARLRRRVRVLGQPVGMHIAAVVRSSRSAREIAERVRARNVIVHPVSGAVPGIGDDQAAFVFGFGNTPLGAIPRGVDAFADVVLQR